MSTELRDVKQRISGTRQIRKVSSALQMIASAQLQQVRRDIVHSNRYTEILRGLLQRFRRGLGEDHPLLTENNQESRTLIVFGADRGLCGGFNSGLSEETERFVRSGDRTELLVVGNAVRRYIERAGIPVKKHLSQPRKNGWKDLVSELESQCTERFLSSTTGEVWVIYSHFVTAWLQEPRAERILPIPDVPAESEKIRDESLSLGTVEPSPESVVEWSIREWIHRSIFNAFLNSLGSEAAARQKAMSRASDNAENIIEELSMLYRRLRQDSITMEMLDLSSGRVLT